MKYTTPFLSAALLVCAALRVQAYDGTNCRAPGECWEPKPGFPDKIAGSKYGCRN